MYGCISTLLYREVKLRRGGISLNGCISTLQYRVIKLNGFFSCSNTSRTSSCTGRGGSGSWSWSRVGRAGEVELEVYLELVVPTFNGQASALSSAPKTPKLVDKAFQLVNFTVSHCSS